MQILKTLLVLFLLLAIASLNAQNLRAQKKYFPKAIKKMKVYLGSTEARLLARCPECKDLKTGESFRTIYSTPLRSKAFTMAIFYVSKETQELYEMILVAKDDVDVNPVAKQLLGDPNLEEEWRFLPDQTRQDFTLAAWTFKNKLIIAGDLQGSEWEPGFNQ